MFKERNSSAIHSTTACGTDGHRHQRTSAPIEHRHVTLGPTVITAWVCWSRHWWPPASKPAALVAAGLPTGVGIGGGRLGHMFVRKAPGIGACCHCAVVTQAMCAASPWACAVISTLPSSPCCLLHHVACFTTLPSSLYAIALTGV